MERQDAEAGATGDAPEAPNHSPEEDPYARAQELEERAHRYLANWQRAQADLQNFRKQVERDQEELVQFASASLMQQTLSVLDDFERAFSTVPANLLSLTWIEGVWLVYKKLETLLIARGLEAVEASPGQQFDPTLHQAISEVDGEAGKIVDAVQRGYTAGGRLLRPALVTVGNGSVPAGDAPTQDSGESDGPATDAEEAPDAAADSTP